LMKSKKNAQISLCTFFVFSAEIFTAIFS
jgi:hypothetical protein